MECRIFLVFYAVFLEKYSAQQNIWWVVSRYELKIILPWKCLAPRYSVCPVRYKLNQISGEGNGNPLQFSCLGNLRVGGAWWVAVYGVAQSRTWLSDFAFTFHFHALEKEMATHSSVLAWRIPGTGEPGGLPSMGLHRVRQDLAAATGANYYI